MMLVKPRDGLLIRDPERHDYIEATGRVVPESVYWIRRLTDGDVVIVEPVIAAPPVQPVKDDVAEAAPKKTKIIKGGADIA